MFLVYLILVVLMLICVGFLACNKQVRERFEVKETIYSEIDVIKAYDKVLQRQPTAKEMMDALNKLKEQEITIDDLEGRLMDTDEYQRIIKVQSNSLTPELDKILHERKQLAFLSNIYFGERLDNIPPQMLMPFRDVYIYLEYSEPALRLVLQDNKYPAFEKRILNEFQLSKDKTLRIFDEMFDKKELMNKVRDLKIAKVATDVKDPPTLGRAIDAVSDANPSGTATQAVVAKDPSSSSQTVVAAASSKESFTDYQPASQEPPTGVSLNSTVYRTVRDKDSNSADAMFDVEQRSKEIFDIHKVAQRLDDTPDAFVYVPVVPVRFADPVTHFPSKPPGNHDPFVEDLYGCIKGAPIAI